jgi:RNA polymerase sigma-B factor
MQKTSAGQQTTSLDGVLLRVKANQEALVDTSRRRTEVVSVAARRRQVAQQLRREVREQLDHLVAGIAAARKIRPVTRRSGGVAQRRYSPRRLDAVDVARRGMHASYADTRSAATRAELMKSYDGFARAMALKFRHRENVDDLVQVARIGLLHAIDRFDPELGRPFPLFARITITGELKRHIRDKTWAMRVPRSLQEDYLSVMQAVDELTVERSDSPPMEAVAERCGLTLERVIEAMELRLNQRAVSIDAPAAPGTDEPGLEVGEEDTGFGHLDDSDLIAQLLARLPERDRRIIELRFMDEMTQSEIAAEIGVSQMCVSRVLARTLGRLRLWARSAAD